ncbi:hypothetical protein [Pseudomonas nunensis]|uniref:Transcriptional regulator n=1 Tax=Pseudomonas nunensis TaxID=2961896 RepID=A0ABY5EFE6_9PSED|nr:hypothetical protein [Pseudomonas nunensis]KOX99351.1 hypothetical protein AM274_25655 [Pseudomonas nunensis]KPN89084.1 hypothetical protein AL066_23565 [Pseudomonas nunensis]MCL5226696.1 transcriptional regulator [Pseudomonas nunensis]UTO13415.1 transcriptional regulator [Pseudomonas nunensis]
MTEQFTCWNSAEYLRSEEEIAYYLAVCLDEAGSDPAFIARALAIIASARSMNLAALDIPERGL